MALLAYALVRPRTPLVVWMHSEVIRRAAHAACSTSRFDPGARGVPRIVVASPPMLDAPSLAFRDKCVVVPYGTIRRPMRLRPSRGPRRGADRSFRRQAGGLQGVDVLARCGLPVRAVIVGDGPAARRSRRWRRNWVWRSA
jgi:hypothetical protein